MPELSKGLMPQSEFEVEHGRIGTPLGKFDYMITL